MNQAFRRFQDLTRWFMWWEYKVPPLLFFAYAFLYISGAPFSGGVWRTALILCWITGTAGAGYVMNDVADAKADLAAGKTNHVASLSGPGRKRLMAFVLALSFLPWLFLPLTFPAAVLVALEYALLYAYSYEPLRLKERVLGGPAADALFGHALPALIVALTFQAVAGRALFPAPFFLVLFFWRFFGGVRNILSHQIDDRKNDRATGTQTFVTRHGPLFALNLVNFLVLPLEMIFLGIFAWWLSGEVPFFWLIPLVFLVFTGMQFALWRIIKSPGRYLLKKFLYFLNDFYEQWMPCAILLFLVGQSFSYALLAAVHLALFQGVLTSLPKNLGTIKKNLGPGQG